MKQEETWKSFLRRVRGAIYITLMIFGGIQTARAPILRYALIVSRKVSGPASCRLLCPQFEVSGSVNGSSRLNSPVIDARRLLRLHYFPLVVARK